MPGELRRRRHGGRADPDERLGLVRRAVPDREVMPDFDEALGDGAAHAAQSCDADAHVRAPSLTL
jgi:hypothetical protein